MNRYIAEGVLDDLALKRSVLVVSPSLRESAQAHDRVVVQMLDDGLEDDYTWSDQAGGQWVRNERQGTAATFVSIGSTMIDHAAGDVVVINGYRRMIGDGPTGPGGAALARVLAATNGRDAVVID